MSDFDVNMVTWTTQLTKGVHRELYPYLDPSRRELSAQGKKVLISGASGGVARKIAEAWAIAKADGIFLTGRNTKILNEVAAKIQPHSPSTKIVVHSADLTDFSSAEQLWKEAEKQLGKIDVLINSAGTMNWGLVGDMNPKQWWNDFEINVKANYLLIHYFVKQAKGNGTAITLSSGAAGHHASNMTSYNASKLAQHKFTELVQEDQPDLRFFTLHPGILATGMTAEAFMPYAIDDPMLSGGFSLYLCTPTADWLKGQTVSVNWDIEEMEKHKEEIKGKNLLRLGYLNATLRKGGHAWEK